MAASANPLKAAFLFPLNLVGVAAAAVASAATLDPLPLLVGAGAELLWLGVVPSLPPFRRAVQRRALEARRAERRAELAAMLDALAPSQRESVLRLQDLRDRTLENYQRVPGGRALVEGSADRFDTLIGAFVRLLATLNAYRSYLDVTDPKALEQEGAELEQEIGRTGDEKLREIQRHRLEILRQRLDRFARATEGREVVSHQLASIEDLLRLMHEQSLTVRDPHAVGAQLDHLALEIEATSETVREMDRIGALHDEASLLAGDSRLPTERERAH